MNRSVKTTYLKCWHCIVRPIVAVGEYQNEDRAGRIERRLVWGLCAACEPYWGNADVARYLWGSRGRSRVDLQGPRTDSFDGTLGRQESFEEVRSEYRAFSPRAARALALAERQEQSRWEMEQHTPLLRLRNWVRRLIRRILYVRGG
jgi:hypothetical protein